jgi:hypothetical protein
MIRDSVEYLKFTLKDRDSASLSGDSVTVALVTLGAPTAAATWLPCTYVSGTTWRTTSAITWSADNYPAHSYRAYVKVADFPETPMCFAGTVAIQ